MVLRKIGRATVISRRWEVLGLGVMVDCLPPGQGHKHKDASKTVSDQGGQRQGRASDL